MKKSLKFKKKIIFYKTFSSDTPCIRIIIKNLLKLFICLVYAYLPNLVWLKYIKFIIAVRKNFKIIKKSFLIKKINLMWTYSNLWTNKTDFVASFPLLPFIYFQFYFCYIFIKFYWIEIRKHVSRVMTLLRCLVCR